MPTAHTRRARPAAATPPHHEAVELERLHRRPETAPRGAAPALAFLAATAVGLVGQKALKRRWGRLRPCLRPGGPPQRAPIPDSGSFPSGHTLHATLSAVTAAVLLPVLAPALILVALLVGASRVLLGVHYPSDVAAGAALGGLLGMMVGMAV